jgi:uncharacterized OB-fold protein
VVGYDKPLPLADSLTQFYWEGARDHKLLIQRCQEAGCRHWIHWPRPICPKCQSSNLAPEPVSGRGSVHSYTLVHQLFHPSFKDDIPYAVVLVELEEQAGVRIVSNLRDCPPDQIRIGMPVEATFEDLTPEVSLPQFRAVDR